MKFTTVQKFCDGCGAKLNFGSVISYSAATGFPSLVAAVCPNYRRGWFDSNGCTNSLADVVPVKSRKKK